MGGLICLFKGRRGCGKTLSMTYWARLYHRLGWKVFSNYKLSFSDEIRDDFVFTLSSDSNLRNCVILIDEMQIFFDSRLWTSSKSISFSHFIQQLRKRNIILLGTTQFLDTIEKRIRQHVDILIMPNYDEFNDICENVVVDVTSLEADDLDYFSMSFKGSDFFNFYDTKQMFKSNIKI